MLTNTQDQTFDVSNDSRFESDLRDDEWENIGPPIENFFRDIRKSGSGRNRKYSLREILNAIFYIMSTNCKWRNLPKDHFPPYSAVRYYYRLLMDTELLEELHQKLVKERKNP